MASFPALPSGDNPYIGAASDAASAASGVASGQKKKRGDGWDVTNSVPLPTEMEAES